MRSSILLRIGLLLAWAAAPVVVEAQTLPACPFPAGAPVRYSETLTTTAIVGGARDSSRATARSRGWIEIVPDPTGAHATYTRTTTSDESTTAATGATAQFRFAHGDCGAGISDLVNGPREVAQEIDHHIDGFLIVPSPQFVLVPGSSWSDTLRRSDSIPGGRALSVLVRRFRVAGDTTVARTAAVVVATESEGTVVRDEALGLDTVRVTISTSARGSAILAHDSRVMLARRDSTDFSITAMTGSMVMPEQRVRQRRELLLEHP